jgi:hypothetical protein
MGLYHIQLPEDAKSFLKEGKDSAIVAAASAAEAKLVMKASLGLPSDAAWAAATVTEITEGTDLAGWRAKITVRVAGGGAIVETVTVTGVTVADFDSIGALLVTALNGTASIAAASYSTPTLTVAAAGDNLGDHTVEAEFLPPTTWDDPTISFPSFYGTITHEGAAGSALTVVLNDIKLPALKYQVGSGH